MAVYYLPLLLLASFVWACFHFLIKPLMFGTASLPPGPRPFPIIGNILDLGKKPHQTLANLSKIYGPIMTLKLGSMTSIVFSSPDMAKNVLQKHDLALSSRRVPDSARALDHDKFSMAWLPVSAPWRNLRKTCAIHMFTAQRLDASQALRQKKVQELLDYVSENCSSGSAVNIGRVAFTTVLNFISNTFFSIDLTHYSSDLSQSFQDLVCTAMRESGKPNLADYFPVLKSVDPQGVRRRMTTYLERVLRIFDDIIDERMRSRNASSISKEKNDLLDSLLNRVEEDNSELSLMDMKHLLLDLFFAGTDTTSSTVEWAMAELLRNPQKLKKVQNELREVYGKDGTVKEFEISKFPYLQAIVKETLRLHPPSPLLVPHKAETEVEICGYMVPKDAQVLVNLWAMGRDPSIWPDPNSFVPERFLECEIDVRDPEFKFIPFGAGRRICPGLPLAQRMVHLMLASLVYTFDWKLPDNMGPESVDMSEEFGITLHKAEPLWATPIKL